MSGWEWAPGFISRHLRLQNYCVHYVDHLGSEFKVDRTSMSRPQLSSGDSESSGTSVDSSGTTATSATSLTSGSQLDGLSPSSPPQPSEESKSTNGIELQELDDGLNEDANSNDENLDDQQAFPGRSTSATGVEPPERRGSSFSASSLAFFGLNGEKWRRVFLLHICLALIFNGFTLALAIYSTFWGDNNVLQKLDEMQKPIGDVNAAGKCSDSAQQDRLEALARWNSFNNWIMSCSAYAVSTTFATVRRRCRHMSSRYWCRSKILRVEGARGP